MFEVGADVPELEKIVPEKLHEHAVNCAARRGENLRGHAYTCTCQWGKRVAQEKARLEAYFRAYGATVLAEAELDPTWIERVHLLTELDARPYDLGESSS